MDPHIDPFAQILMEGMQTLLNLFTNLKSSTYDKWGASACQAAISLGQGTYCAQQLAWLLRQFIKYHTVLPLNPYGEWNESLLVDEDLLMEVNLYLQKLGTKISAKRWLSSWCIQISRRSMELFGVNSMTFHGTKEGEVC